MEQKLKIVYRNYGIADRFPDGVIEMNKHLDDYPSLKRSILEHEIKHTNNEKFNRKDLIHDLATINQFNQFQMIKFMFRHPLSLVQVLPLYYTKKRGFIYDQVAALFWLIGLSVIGVAIFIGFSI